MKKQRLLIELNNFYLQRKDDIINELRNSSVSASDVALESGMTENELLDLLTLKEKDYLAYKTADTTIKKLSKSLNSDISKRYDNGHFKLK